MEKPESMEAAPPIERAVFIERMTGELSRLANEAGMGMLSYLLDMAREEASLVKSNHERVEEPDVVVTPRRRGRPIRRSE